jgi:hypothetical protein
MYFTMEINTSADQSGAMPAMVREFPGDDPKRRHNTSAPPGRNPGGDHESHARPRSHQDRQDLEKEKH